MEHHVDLDHLERLLVIALATITQLEADMAATQADVDALKARVDNDITLAQQLLEASTAKDATIADLQAQLAAVGVDTTALSASVDTLDTTLAPPA